MEVELGKKNEESSELKCSMKLFWEIMKGKDREITILSEQIKSLEEEKAATISAFDAMPTNLNQAKAEL